MLTFITTPTDMVAQISTVATGILSDFAPYATLIIGVGFGLWILNSFINSLKKDKTKFENEELSLNEENEDF